MMQQTGDVAGAMSVAVLLGGSSAEREISLQSGAAVTKALRGLGHQVHEIDPARTDLECFDWSPIDVAFIALHGSFGEDGRVQDLLDRAAVPYTGSDAAASRLAFSKSTAKDRLREAGVPTPEYLLIHRSDSPVRLRSMAGMLRYPLVIKPDRQGSSLGVSLLRGPFDVPQASQACFEYGDFGILECAVSGGEWTLAVLGDEPLPPIRIAPRRAFYDFAAKYEDDGTGFEFASADSLQTAEAVTQVGLAACAALGTAGIARVDLRVDADGRPWVLEVNTVPGMTDHSLAPKAAARVGMSFADLCQWAVDAALRNHQDPHDSANRFAVVAESQHRRAG